jgi:hypothetical protein
LSLFKRSSCALPALALVFATTAACGSGSPTASVTVTAIGEGRTVTATATATAVTRIVTKSVTTTAARPTGAAEPPRGSMDVEFAGADFGQSGSHAQCSDWLLRFRNNSNTEIVKITITAASASYEDINRHTTIRATPEPTVLKVSIPAYRYQDLNFQTCTSTPLPVGSGYEYDESRPFQAAYSWTTGQVATVSF